jgi:MFS family permease
MSKSRLWTRNFTAIFSSSFFLYLGYMMLHLLLPIHMNRLGADDTTVGLAMALFMLSGLIIRPFAGAALDHWGRRPLLLITMASTLLLTLAYSRVGITGIIIIHFLQGFSWAAAATSVTTIVSDQLPKSIYGMGFGVFSLSTSLPLGLGPLLALALFEGRGFGILTLVAAGLTGIAILFIPLLQYPRQPESKLLRIRGSLIEKCALIPSVTVLICNIPYGAVSGFVILHGEEQGILRIGVYFTVFALVFMTTRPFFGRLVDRIGYPKLLYPGLALIAAGMVLLGLRPEYYLLNASLYAIGDSAIQSSLNTLAITRADPQRLGAANATFYTGFDAGVGLGSILGGALASALGYGPMFLVMAAMPVLAGLVAVVGLRE